VSRTGGETITVLAVDDYEPYRVAAAAVVNATPGFEFIGDVASGEDAVDTVIRLRPDVVLLDVNMPDADGIQTSRRLAGATHPPVVILVSAEDDAVADDVLSSCGAAAFVPKRRLSPHMLRAIWARHRT
jgi:DNA-binding NarL/FixJ family response regulator